MQQIAERLGPNAQRMLGYWCGLPKSAGVPERRSFDPMAVTAILPVISLLQHGTGGEWLFRLCGTEIERRWDTVFTGHDYFAVDLVSPPAVDTMRREFQQVVDWPCGSWARREVEFRSGRRAVIETLRLPLRANDGSISLILSCSEEFPDAPLNAIDGPREIITLTEQRFFDIGAGNPPESVLPGRRPP